MKIEDLPAHMQAQARKQLDALQRIPPVRYQEMQPVPAPDTPKRAAGSMTKTEAKYSRGLEALRLAGEIESWVFHPAKLRLENGHVYSPDFMVRRKSEPKTMIEVKGAYRLGSYRSARLAFDQARIDWPEFGWMWVEKQSDGTFRQS